MPLSPNHQRLSVALRIVSARR